MLIMNWQQIKDKIIHRFFDVIEYDEDGNVIDDEDYDDEYDESYDEDE